MNTQDSRVVFAAISGLVVLGAPAAMANDIEPSKEFYTALPAPSQVMIDGNLDEWTGIPVLADPRFSIPKGSGDNGELVIFEEHNGGNWTGPDDHTSAVQVSYDEDNVYFGFIVTDDYHENSRNSAWNGDSIQLMIADETRSIQIGLYNYALGGIEGALGDVIVMHEAGPGGTDAVITRNAETKQTNYEIILPKSALELDELVPGVQFGLGMAINDGDGEPGQDGQKGWSGLGAHALVFGKSPGETALVTLGEPPPPPVVLEHINDIEPGKEFYTAIKAVNPIVLDGELDEWTGAQVLADPRFAVPKGSRGAGELVNFEEHNGGNWTGPDDQTSAVRIVYDDDNVYFGFVVTDDYHENSANSAWNGDSVQLMIADETRQSQVALYNYALGGVEGALGDVIVMHEAGPGGTNAVVKRDEETKRTTYEICLPKEALALDSLIGGTQFGLGMAINDGDGEPGQNGQKGWGGLGAHALVFGKSPEETALVTLATANDIEPGKEHYFASPARGPVVLDGQLDDPGWFGVGVLSDPRFAVPKGSGARGDDAGELTLFEEHSGGQWNGADDQTSAVQIVYDDENVYFAFVVTDDYHENSANSAWNGDSVQLMIANERQDTQVALYNYALGGVEGALGDVIVMHEAGPGGTEAVVARNAETMRTIYEIKLPRESMDLASLERGTQFGLGMAINDGDGEPGQNGQKGWGGLGAHALVFGKSPSETALVTLNVSAPSSPCFISAFKTPDDFDLLNVSFRGNDFESCIVDPLATRLFIDGQQVPLEVGEKRLGATDFTHTLPEPLRTGSEHTFRIELVATDGSMTVESGTFTAPIFGILTPEMKATQVDTSRPGFTWRIFQNELFVHTDIDRTEAVLRGEGIDDFGAPVVENYADPSVVGIATGEGSVLEPVGHLDPIGLVEFEIPTVINLNAIGGDVLGNFQPDDQMPGVPGMFFSADGASAEAVTYVEFPAGFTILGVNSDDAFRAVAGFIDDPEQRELLGEFNGPRGSADTTFLLEVQEAGVYPLRVFWNNGGGGAHLEIFSVLEDGTRVLINDVANGGLRSYRGAAGPGEKPFLITDITLDPVTGDLVIEWNSKSGELYALDATADLRTTWQELDDGIASGGNTSVTTVDAGTVATLEENGRIFFRIRRQ